MGLVLLLGLSLLGCSGGSGKTNDAGRDGSPGTGGIRGSGGSPATGGTMVTGGTVALGGSPATGGAIVIDAGRDTSDLDVSRDNGGQAATNDAGSDSVAPDSAKFDLLARDGLSSDVADTSPAAPDVAQDSAADGASDTMKNSPEAGAETAMDLLGSGPAFSACFAYSNTIRNCSVYCGNQGKTCVQAGCGEHTYEIWRSSAECTYNLPFTGWSAQACTALIPTLGTGTTIRCCCQ